MLQTKIALFYTEKTINKFSNMGSSNSISPSSQNNIINQIGISYSRLTPFVRSNTQYVINDTASYLLAASNSHFNNKDSQKQLLRLSSTLRRQSPAALNKIMGQCLKKIADGMGNRCIYKLDPFESLMSSDLLVKEREQRLLDQPGNSDGEDNDSNDEGSFTHMMNEKSSKIKIFHDSSNAIEFPPSSNNNFPKKMSLKSKLSKKPSNLSDENNNLMVQKPNKKAFRRACSINTYQVQPKTKVEHYRQECKNYIIVKKYRGSLSKTSTKILSYFAAEQDLENFISNLIKLKQQFGMTQTSNQRVSEISCQVYKNYTVVTQQPLYIVERLLAQGVQINSNKSKNIKQILRSQMNKFFQYMHFLSVVLSKIDNIVISPEDVYSEDGQLYLLDFKYASDHITPSFIMLATMDWIFYNGNTNCSYSQSLSSDQNENISFDQFLNQKNTMYVSSLLQETAIDNSSSDRSSSSANNISIFVKQLYSCISNNKLQKNDLTDYIYRLRNKAFSLNYGIDSFHACVHHRKTYLFSQEKHSWLIGKKLNEVYFYHLIDDHRCQVKLIRKKRKIDLSNTRISFDPEELQIKYIAQNSKLVIHAGQFELQRPSCLTDIEIKHKLPVKFKNPYLFYHEKKSELIIFQNYVYRYSPDQNKLYQVSKKLIDVIFLARSYDHSFLVVKMSIDILKNGIKVFVDQKDIDLMFIGDQSTMQELSNIRVDIRHVEFCREVYKGVYLMFANKNFWILDIKFMLFFSFATIERIKYCYGFSGSKHGNILEESGQFVFEIFDQNFKVDFLSHQQGLNVKIQSNILHIIGQIQGNLYYLKYLFLPEAGSLKFLTYKPLFGEDRKASTIPKQPINLLSEQSCLQDKQMQNAHQSQSKLKKSSTKGVKRVQIKTEETEADEEAEKDNEQNSKIEQAKGSALKSIISTMNKQFSSFDEKQCKKYHFNFHEENLEYYKNQKWIFNEKALFLSPKDFYLKTNNTTYEIQLVIPKTKSSLKDLIEKIKKTNSKQSSSTDSQLIYNAKGSHKKFNKEETIMYCLRVIEIYQWLIKNQLYHRNISIHNLYFTEKQNILKLIGWSEPSRNWYVSDYKDILLVFFNIITFNFFEKLTEKYIQKFEAELMEFPPIYEKMINAFKFSKTAQKKVQIEKDLSQIKEYLHKQYSIAFIEIPNSEQKKESEKQESLLLLLKNKKKKLSKKPIPKNMIYPHQQLPNIQSPSITNRDPNCLISNEFIFNFEYNTPRVSMISIFKNKMKKIKCILDQNSQEELIFKNTDKHLWNEADGELYVFTSSYQFYQIKIKTGNFKEEVIICEQYEYLPHNILESSFVFVPKKGIYSIGGIYKKGKSCNAQLTFNTTMYKFNTEKLTWDAIIELPQGRMNPHLVLSKDAKKLYIMGGDIDHENNDFKCMKINLDELSEFEEKVIAHKSRNKENQDQLFSGENADLVQPPDIVRFLTAPSFQSPFKSFKVANFPLRIMNLSTFYNTFLLFYINNDKYYVRIFSLTSFCIDIQIETKNYSDDNSSKIISSAVGISLNGNVLHVLRPYGRYAKIQINKMETLLLTNQTLYGDREREERMN